MSIVDAILGKVLALAEGDKRYGRLGEGDVWTPGSSRPVKLGDGATTSTYTAATTRLSEVVPFAAVAVRLIYGNIQNAFGSAEAPNYTSFRVKASVHRAGTAAPDRALTDPVYPVTFRGGALGVCAPGAFLVSDTIRVPLALGERWWHESYADVNLGPGPAAPTLALTSGAGLGVGTAYQVQITYVYPDDTESAPSAVSTITPTSGQQSIIVTAPAAVPGIVGYRIYVASSAGQPGYENPALPVQPLGVNATITGVITATALNRMVRAASNAGLPVGRGLLAGVGENTISGRDYTQAPVAWTGTPSFAGTFSPMFVEYIAADGRKHVNAAISGDSIAAGTGEYGYGAALGGAGFRACANQTQAVVFDSTKVPAVTFGQFAQGGETLATYLTAAGGARRRSLMERFSTVLSNYGTNDLGAGAASLCANLVAELGLWAGRKKFFRLTLDPKTTSTDGWATLLNQLFQGNQSEADRRMVNNFIRSTTGAVAVAADALFRIGASPFGPTSTVTGGDGTAVRFIASQPFRTGTETIKVNGTTKTVTTDYSYYGTATIDGVTYASGVTFTTAPSNAATVTADYTKAAGLASRTGLTGVFDTAAAIEVDGSGNPGTNGGFWAPGTGTTVTGTPTAAATTSVTDTSKTNTVNAYSGWMLRITADPTTPASIGQAVPIQSNTATVYTLGLAFTTVPSTAATYIVYPGPTIDGTHNTSLTAMLKSRLIDTTRF